ncbi:MAG: hypothetical protein ABI557_13340 [Aureliella sp.]
MGKYTKSMLAFILAFTMVAGYCRAAVPSAAGWNPERTWVFCVGILEWKDPKYSSFPKENRQDLEFVKVLKERGVPDKQVAVLTDKQATSENINKHFHAFVSKPAAGDTLILYYCR